MHKIFSIITMSLLVSLLCACGGKVSSPLMDDASFRSSLEQAGQHGTSGIALVAPSSGPKGEYRDRLYRMSKHFGLTLPDEAIKNEAVPYNASDDETRFSLLAAALADNNKDIIWAVRGGYGASRLLDKLGRLPVAAGKKVFIGYSDTTFLHLYAQKQGWKSLHASLFGEIASLNKDPENFRLLARVLAGSVDELDYGPLAPVNIPSAKQGKISGELTGGNLTCLASAAGTPWALSGSGKIIVLEDVKEPGYKVDRMLRQLADSGAFNGAVAIIFGSFTSGDEYTDFAIERFARESSIPVLRADLFGHGQHNYPLIFGANATLVPEVGGTYSLRIDAKGLF